MRALGAVACKLFAPDSGAPQHRARRLLLAVYRALLLAMEDYSADSRCGHKQCATICAPALRLFITCYRYFSCRLHASYRLHPSAHVISDLCCRRHVGCATAERTVSCPSDTLSSGSLPVVAVCSGDVGSWVREAALEALARAVPLAPAVLPDTEAGGLLADVTPRAVGACLQQAVERIARVREVSRASRPVAEPTLPERVALAQRRSEAVASLSTLCRRQGQDEVLD